MRGLALARPLRAAGRGATLAEAGTGRSASGRPSARAGLGHDLLGVRAVPVAVEDADDARSDAASPERGIADENECVRRVAVTAHHPLDQPDLSERRYPLDQEVEERLGVQIDSDVSVRPAVRAVPEIDHGSAATEL